MQKLMLLLSIILVAGCVTTPVITKGVFIKLDANPPQIFTDSKTTLSIDIDNKDTKTIRDVNVDVFETGVLYEPALKKTASSKECFDIRGSCNSAPCEKEKDLGVCGGPTTPYCCGVAKMCKKSIQEMKPNAFDSFFCNLYAPQEIGAQKVATTVFARAGFTTSLAATQLVKIISQNEYDLRKKTGKFVTEPLSYAYRDNNLELLVEFSDSPPLVVSNKKFFVSFTIRNIGNGFIEKIKKADIKIISPGLINCPDIQDMFISGAQFPKFACEISLPGDITFLSDRTINIDITYNYEVRNSIDVEIKR